MNNDTLKLTGSYDFLIYARFEKWYMRAANRLLSRISKPLQNMFLARFGRVRDAFSVNNSVVTVGKGLVTSRLGSNSANPPTYLALGTSSTAVSAGQTALQAEITESGLARASATVSQQTTTTTNDTYRATYTWTASGTKSIEEIGVFNASSSGTMLSRALTTTKSVVSGETVVGTYNLAFS